MTTILQNDTGKDNSMKERYDNLDGFRTISCLCIIAMHIRANASYSLPLVLDSIVASWTQFVPLFLMVSGFGMFCGYYEKFRDGSIDLKSFYSKRYSKLIPFFLVLIIIDIVIDRSISHVIEGIMEATLVFGLLPNNQMEVIGVLDNRRRPGLYAQRKRQSFYFEAQMDLARVLSLLNSGMVFYPWPSRRD